MRPSASALNSPTSADGSTPRWPSLKSVSGRPTSSATSTLIHPTRLQIIGAAELAWARRQTTDKVAHHLNEILSTWPPAIIIADGCAASNIIHGICEAHDVALFTTPRRSPRPA